MPDNVVIKQADAVLISSSLSLSLANYTLAYYNQKQTTDGLAMTYSVMQRNKNRIAQSGCAAFTFDVQSKFPNLRAPWYQMSEQVVDDINENRGAPPAYPFLTGHWGGTTTFGYLGLDLSEEDLTIRPSLPPPIEHLALQDIVFKGNMFRARMNATYTTITRLQPPKSITGLVDAYLDTSMPLIVETRDCSLGTPTIISTPYEISMSETVTVENDMYWTNPPHQETSSNASPPAPSPRTHQINTPLQQQRQHRREMATQARNGNLLLAPAQTSPSTPRSSLPSLYEKRSSIGVPAPSFRISWFLKSYSRGTYND